jgi:hypothetical protein
MIRRMQVGKVRRWMVWLVLVLVPLRLWAADLSPMHMLTSVSQTAGSPAPAATTAQQSSPDCHGNPTAAATAQVAADSVAVEQSHTCGSCQTCHSIAMPLYSERERALAAAQHCPNAGTTHDATVWLAPLTKPPIS